MGYRPKESYDLRKAQPRDILPAIDLLPPIPYRGKTLDVAVFGPDSYHRNLEKMRKRYFHSEALPKVTFTPTATPESIAIAAYGFGNGQAFDAKRDILEMRGLQLGRVVTTEKGVFTNTVETDDAVLERMLAGAEKLGDIFFIDTTRAFAPWNTFTRVLQTTEDFVYGGLARALAHTRNPAAEYLEEISSVKNYKSGVDVRGFTQTSVPTIMVASLGSYRHFDGRLDVDGYVVSGYDVGYAFGIMVPADETKKE